MASRKLAPVPLDRMSFVDTRDNLEESDWSPDGPKFEGDQRAELMLRIEAGECIEQICASRPDWPGPMQVYNQLRTDPGFRSRYQRAIEIKYERLADRMFELSLPDGPLGYMTLQERRLVLDTLKWVASRRARGYRPDVVVNFNDEGDETGVSGAPFLVVPAKKKA